MTAEYTRRIYGQGIIAGPDWLSLPATLYSETGGFYHTVTTRADLLQFLRTHRATPRAYFDVKAVWRYYCEQPGDVTYSASEFHIRSENDTRGMMRGYEGLY